MTKNFRLFNITISRIFWNRIPWAVFDRLMFIISSQNFENRR